MIRPKPPAIYRTWTVEEDNRMFRMKREGKTNFQIATLGWMYTLNADLLLYHFVKDDRLYKIPFQKLKRWAFHDRRIFDFPERRQSKYSQLNDTWGRCVPIEIISSELNLSQPFCPSEFVFQKGAA